MLYRDSSSLRAAGLGVSELEDRETLPKSNEENSPRCRLSRRYISLDISPVRSKRILAYEISSEGVKGVMC